MMPIAPGEKGSDKHVPGVAELGDVFVKDDVVNIALLLLGLKKQRDYPLPPAGGTRDRPWLGGWGPGLMFSAVPLGCLKTDWRFRWGG